MRHLCRMMTGEFACLDRVYMMVSRDAGQLIRGVQRDHSDVCFFLGFAGEARIFPRYAASTCRSSDIDLSRGVKDVLKRSNTLMS